MQKTEDGKIKKNKLSTYNALILDCLQLVRVNDGEDGHDEGVRATHNSREACPKEGLEQSVDSSCKQQCLEYPHLLILHR